MPRHTLRMLKALMLVAGLSFLIRGVVADEPEIWVRAGWIREAPPVSTMLAGYLTIENKTKKAVEVIGARSPDFARVEIHRTEVTDGVARMIRQEQIVVLAGSTQRFEPGGYHLMLIKPLRPLLRGDRVELELSLGDGRLVQGELMVSR